MKRPEITYLQEALGVEVVQASSRPVFYAFTLPDGRAYLLPGGSQKAISASLSLYRPQRVLGNLLVAGARLTPWLLPAVNLLGIDAWKDFFSDSFQRHDLELAISLGTPSLHRKPVIQILANDGEILGFAKVGWNETTKNLVECEARAVEQVSRSAKNLLVPQVLFHGSYKEYMLCVQSTQTGKSQSLPRQLTSLVVEAVIELADINRCNRPLCESAFWNDLGQRVEQVEDSDSRQRLRDGMQTLLSVMGEQKIPFHVSHGDLVPWNAFQVGDQIYLFDWEYASFDRPAGYDLCHFLVQVSSLVRKASVSDIHSWTMDALQREAVSRYWRHVNFNFHPALFALHLLDRLAFASLEKLTALNPSRFLDQLVDLCLNEIR